MKKWLVGMVCLACLTIATPLAASPLYGGYNGESPLWTDVFFFGMDNQGRWWIRIPVDVVQGFLRLIFKYESTGVVSAEIAGSNIPNFSGGGDFLFGSDSSGLFWSVYNEAGLSNGSDSNGNSWTEQTLFDYFGTGSDNNDRLWGYVTYTYENVLPLKAGINLSAFLPEPEPSPTTQPSGSQTQPKHNCSLPNPFQYEKGSHLIAFIISLSMDDACREMATQTLPSLNLPSLLTFADEQLFTEKRREKMADMVNGFMAAGNTP